MGLEILDGITTIDGETVVNMDKLREQFPEKFNESGAMDWQWFKSEIRPNAFIYVRNDKSSISFTMQDAPIGEVGKNGVQLTALIEAAKIMLERFNQRFPCRENAITITKLDEALMWQRKRTYDRVKRGVEGKNLA